jgi:hypothetical protein
MTANDARCIRRASNFWIEPRRVDSKGSISLDERVAMMRVAKAAQTGSAE